MTHAVQKVTVTSRSFSRNAFLREELLKKYPNAKFNETGESLEGESLIKFLQGFDAAIIALEKLTPAVVAELTDTKVISKYGVGLDNISLDALQKKGIRLAWTGGVNKRSVAELALFKILGSLRKSFFSNQSVRTDNWHQVIGRTLTEKTVGLIGLGHVGQELVHLLRPFQCRVLAYDILDRSKFAQDNYVTLANFDVVLAESDVISLHIPLTSLTKGLIAKSAFEKMKREAVVINTSRGGIVNESDLVCALESKLIAGAAFDVFNEEPFRDKRLIEHPNFFCTSHIGGSAEESIRAMGLAAIEGLARAKEAKIENFFDYPL